MESVTVGRAAGSLVLAVPLLACVSLVTVNTGNVLVTVFGLCLIAALMIALHVLAVKAASVLRSTLLPWGIWAAVTASVWIVMIGIAAIGTHFNNVESGIDDSSLIAPAAIAGSLAVLSGVTALVLCGVVAVKVGKARH